MTTRPYFEFLAGAALLTLAACNGIAAVPPVSPQAQLVRVENSDPPDGATPLGEIEVTHGQGCSFTGDRGTLEGATALLKESAVQRGANFVKVTKVTEPYSGHDCTHREFKLAGLSYRIGNAPVVVPSAAPVAAPAAAMPAAAPVAVPAASPTAALTAVPSSAPVAICNPICSPGYVCEAGVCRALCNPACSEGQVCRVDRVCVPAAATP